MRIRVAAVLVLAAVSFGCRRQTDVSSTPTSSPTPSPAALSAGNPTQGPCEKATGGIDTDVRLLEIRTGTHDTYDRITFEFQPAFNPPSIPRYEIDAELPPLTYSPSGEPMAVDGRVYVRVLFFAASRYDLSTSEPRRVYRGKDEIKPGLPVLVEAEMQEDFEATLSWILGLSSQSCWSATELRDPLRVVVDLPH